ncbi:MAG TPA: macro domain-containing protein [bacterium]|nr:macro domain-containing protein [bacterium]HPS28617.1 macro domain-containing protein [bacterium]
MMKFTQGDIFTANTEAIVNTVNCVGVMGRGIALQFKKKFPENFKEYESACNREEVVPGKMFVYETGALFNPRIIINFPTKRHWRGESKIEDIENGLIDLVRIIKEKNIKSIALPPLGCGLGGLDWNKVKVLIAKHLSILNDVEVLVFEPAGAPAAEEMVKNRKVPEMTSGRAALIELVAQYLKGLLDPIVTLLEVHKLMYFLQASGENLRLNYTKGTFGPYSENLRHVLNAIEGHLISGYADGGDKPDKRLKLIPGAYESASEFLETQKNTIKNLERVADLVQGFETPFGMELLSTVHWVVVNEKAASKEDVITKVHAWGERKKQFTPRQILIAVDVLSKKKWVDVSSWVN